MKIGSSGIDPGRPPQTTITYGPRTGHQTATETGAALPMLAPARLLKGIVVSNDAPGVLTVVTELGSFTASSTTPLAIGKEFWFQFIPSSAGAPLLGVAEKAHSVINLLKVLLPGLTLDLEVLTTASSQNEPGFMAAAKDISAAQLLLENAVDALPDPVKLLKTVALLNQKSSGRSLRTEGNDLPLTGNMNDCAAPAGQKLTKLLEAHAAVNQQPTTTGGGDYVIFPVFFAGQAGRGEWLFTFDQNEGDSMEEEQQVAATISFYLSMSRLGDTHLSLTLFRNRLTGTFTLTTPEAAAHVRQHLPQLIEALERVGGPSTITCRSAPFDCVKTLKEELTAKAGLQQFALLDVKV